jgi:hypothetical protein
MVIENQIENQSRKQSIIEPMIVCDPEIRQNKEITELLIEKSNTTIHDQCDVEEELADVLRVRDDSDDAESVLSNLSESRPKPTTKVLKTRKQLIFRIKQTCEHLQILPEDVRKMRLHRKRKNSLERILKEKIGLLVTTKAEEHAGIPQGKPERIEFCVKILYKFDLSCMLIVEKAVSWLNTGYEIKDLARTIDSDPDCRQELQSALRDFISESEYCDVIQEYASPGVRILLAHMYPLVNCLKKVGNVPTEPLPAEVKNAVMSGAIRNIIRPPMRGNASILRPMVKNVRNGLASSNTSLPYFAS